MDFAMDLGAGLGGVGHRLISGTALWCFSRSSQRLGSGHKGILRASPPPSKSSAQLLCPTTAEDADFAAPNARSCPTADAVGQIDPHQRIKQSPSNPLAPFRGRGGCGGCGGSIREGGIFPTFRLSGDMPAKWLQTTVFGGVDYRRRDSRDRQRHHRSEMSDGLD